MAAVTTDSSGRVLIVDDDPELRDLLKTYLERQGFQVATVADGAAMDAWLAQDAADLIVLDLMLPRMSGLDVCRQVRSEMPVPIVMLTARDEESEKVVGLEIGADDYVTKPFSMRELMARVQALLRRDRLSRESAESDSAAPASTLEVGAIVLDATAHEVRRGGQPIPVRPKEYDLLEYFMRHLGQALSRDQILEAVWGYSYSGGTRTVDVHVRWLREKLEADPGQPTHILTVRSVGYKFVP